MIQVAAFDDVGEISSEIQKYSFWNKINNTVFLGAMIPEQLEESIINHDIDVVLAVVSHKSFTQMDFILKIISNYPDTLVVIISNSSEYQDVRKAFLSGAFDYLVYDNLEKDLRKTLMRLSGRRCDNYFNVKIYDKVLLLARHIFDGGDNVLELVHDIVDSIYSDWNDNTIVCQQVIEKVKLESYKHFVRKKPWLEKFIYRGDYIRDIGFELKERPEIEEELCHYYSEVNVLFKKYNVIDVNKTIYTIGKSVIRQVDDKVTLESVASDVYLNKTYVSHIFKEMTGVSFSDFVIDVKMDRAKTLLHYPDISISEIAEILSFCNAGYFSGIFKKHIGISPTNYRLLVKK